MTCMISTLEYSLDDETDNLVESLYSTEDVTFHGNGSWAITQINGNVTNVNECFFGEPRVDTVNRSVALVRFGSVTDEDRHISKQSYVDYLESEILKVGSRLDGLQQELENWTK